MLIVYQCGDLDTCFSCFVACDCDIALYLQSKCSKNEKKLEEKEEVKKKKKWERRKQRICDTYANSAYFIHELLLLSIGLVSIYALYASAQ